MRFRYILRNKNTGKIHKKYYTLNQIQEKGLNHLFDAENYDILHVGRGITTKHNSIDRLFEGDIISGVWECHDTEISFENKVIKYHSDLGAFGFAETSDGDYKTPIENYLNLLSQCNYFNVVGNKIENSDLLS